MKPGRDIEEFTSEYRAKISRAYGTLKVLTSPIPRRIIDILKKYPDGRSVTHIFISLRIERCVCSQHLYLLRKYGLVETRRNGKQIIYRLNQERFEQISDAMDNFFKREPLEISWCQTVVA